MTHVCVLDDYQGAVETLDALRVLEGLDVSIEVRREALDGDDALIDALSVADVVVLIRERTHLSARVIEALPRLKLVVQTGRLAGCIDLDACARKGVAVRAGSGNPTAPVELTWALILAASRRLLDYHDGLRAGRWQVCAHEPSRLGRVLSGRTLGVWGYGKIGQRVARIGQAFGMEVRAHGRDASCQAAKEDGVIFEPDRARFLGGVDVLTLHLRLTEETRHLIRTDTLLGMREDALLVNTSRAELLAPGALMSALEAGRPGMAALDVFEHEPDGVEAYLGHPRILCSPHIGFVERNTYEAYFREAFAHVRAFIDPD